MARTNRIASIYHRLDELAYALACKDLTPIEEDDLLEELCALEEELEELSSEA